MTHERPGAANALVVAGAGAALAALEPLLRAHRRERPVRVVPSAAAVAPILPGAAGVLLVGGAPATPRTALPGPFLCAPDCSAVPVGWLPDAGPRLAIYARAAAEVQSRCLKAGTAGPFILLGEFDERALDAVERFAVLMPQEADVLRWTAERLPRPALIKALGLGAAAAFYFGHGLAGGWAGYGGFGKTCVAQMAGRPLGAVLSISCSSASRTRSSLSFCEELALSGGCAAAFGACGRTLHQPNVELGLCLAHALAENPRTTLGGLLLACQRMGAALARYRIIGDPLSPLAGAHGSGPAARTVFAPGPNDALPVVPLSDWK
jgi:Peptidase family C25